MVSAGSYLCPVGLVVAGVDRLLKVFGDRGVARGRKAQASPSLERARVHRSSKDLQFVGGAFFAVLGFGCRRGFTPNPLRACLVDGAPKPP